MSTPRDRQTRFVVWDWNGTLLDDVDVCVQTLGQLLEQHGRPPLSRDDYRRQFGFPVRAFYESLGFAFEGESFDAFSAAFITAYKQALSAVALHPEVPDLLGRIGVRQLVVSAMEDRMLGEMLTGYGVRPHLEAYRGTNSLAAHSKIDVGRQALAAVAARPEEVLMVGDTIHDHELADAIGCRCVLFAGGHQTRERLEATGRPVIDALEQVLAFL